jgi:long-subunit acyl-CoA synthetase (AMP-forming)
MIRVPFPVCREVESLAEQLVGLRIERGVLGEITKRIGGRVGCSHIKELATNIVYFAASHLVRRRTGVDPMSTDYVHKPAEERFGLTKDLLRDTCLAYCQTTPQGLDERIGIRRVGEEHTHALPLGSHEPSLGVLLRERAEKWKDKVFIRYRVGERDFAITWSEFAERTFQIARHLLAQGVQPGDRICMLSENRAEMYLFEMAVMSIGAATVPIFAGYPQRGVAYVLGHARPRMVVVSGKHQLAKIERQRHACITKYYCMDFDADAAAWGAADFAELTAEGGASREQLDAAIDAVGPDDLCNIMYTSGTTGPPKGVQLCHRNLISQQKATALVWDVTDSDVLLSYLPWHHSFGGLFERFLSLYAGCELCLDDSRGRDIDRLLANWKAFNPSIFLSVPRVHDLVLTQCRERPEIAELVFGGRLRMAFTAGASLPATVEAAYRARNIPVLEGWGLTETSPCVTCTTMEGHWRSGYVGNPIPGVTIRIDSDQEILVKGPNVMLGYLDDEEATSRVFDADGWFHTGDLGEYTADGLRIFGRKDGAFKLTTGEKVHPQRIETVLANESPYISIALVLGSGENYVGALLYPDFSQLQEWAAENGVAEKELLDSPAVRELYAAELERINAMIEVKFQRVLRAVLADRAPLLAAGELTPSGKIVRKAVISTYQNKLDALFAARPPEDVILVPQPETKGTYASAR